MGGRSTFVKFHWKPLLGLQSVVWNEAVKINGADPDFHRRDLWHAIESGSHPEWELGIQLFDDDFADRFEFDVLDATKLIPEELVPIRRVGRLVLDRLVDNFFAETEQVAFCTQNVVPGIDFTNDPLLQGRTFSYLDTQLCPALGHGGYVPKDRVGPCLAGRSGGYVAAATLLDTEDHMTASSNQRASVDLSADGTIVVAGELDAFCAGAVDAVLAALPAGAAGRLDGSGETFIDSSVLRVVLRHRDRLVATGGGLRFVAASEPVRRLLDITRLDGLVGPVPTTPRGETE